MNDPLIIVWPIIVLAFVVGIILGMGVQVWTEIRWYKRRGDDDR